MMKALMVVMKASSYDCRSVQMLGARVRYAANVLLRQFNVNVLSTDKRIRKSTDNYRRTPVCVAESRNGDSIWGKDEVCLPNS